MRCVNCDTELIPGKQFCHACGARAPRACTKCGSVIEAGFRFCPECGTPVDEPAETSVPLQDDHLARLAEDIPPVLAEKIRASRGVIAGERKLVTVLFCDLVGSTAIAERLDPEDYRDLLERYMEVAFREIYRLEGIVNLVAGDGFMALFGAPVAHEDAPHRAVHAALALRTAVAQLAADVRAARGLELRLRVGVHTGPVVVGTVGNDLKMDYTAIGDTTNLASRLQTLADPGVILISEATYRLVRGFFEVKAAQHLAVKGKSEPVVAYEVSCASGSTSPMAIAEARGLTPFVGRDEERAQLVACYERLAGNLGQVAAIVGPGGSGKSRLVYELMQRLAGKPVAFFEARCAAMTQSVPYAPWVGMLRQYFELATDEHADTARAKVAQVLAERGDGLPALHAALCKLVGVPTDGADSLEGLPEDEVKRQTFEAVSQLVHVASIRTPVVMIIEDLHWIDEPSREMLELAVGRIHRGRVMLLVTHRPEYQPAWRLAAAFTQLTLAPLSDEDTAAIIRAVAGGTLPPELEARILEKAEGNPFVTEEITRGLVEEGYVLRSNGAVRLTRPVAEMRLPGTVEELVGARLDRLGPQAKRVVQVAAVLGRQFRRDQLERVLEGDGIDVATELAALERRGVIHRKTVLSDDEFRFGESLTQEVAYEGLLLKQRRELHERIGLLLESLPGEPTAERAALLAHHFARSDNAERAVAALIRAAQDAERIPAFRNAGRFYREAWTLASTALASRAAASQTLRHLALRAAHGACRMAVIYGSAEGVDVAALAVAGRALAQELDDAATFADLCALHGMALTGLGRENFDAGRTLIEEGLAIAERTGDDVTRLRIARALAWAYLFDGRFEQSQATIEGVLAGIEDIPQAERPSDLYLGARYVADRLPYYRDDLATTLRRATETHTLASTLANRTVQCGSAATIAQAHLARGEYAEARRWADRSLETALAIGNLAQLRTAGAVGVIACAELGEHGSLPRYLGHLEQGVSAGVEPLNAGLVVEALLTADEVEQAARYTERAYTSSGGRLRDMVCAAAQGDVLLRLGAARAVEARRWYERASTLADALGVRSTAARALVGLGELAAANGARDEAVGLLAEAITSFRAIGYRHDEARAARALADAERGEQQSA